MHKSIVLISIVAVLGAAGVVAFLNLGNLTGALVQPSAGTANLGSPDNAIDEVIIEGNDTTAASATSESDDGGTANSEDGVSMSEVSQMPDDTEDDCPDQKLPLERVKGHRNVSGRKTKYTSQGIYNNALTGARQSAVAKCVASAKISPAPACKPAASCETNTAVADNGVAGITGGIGTETITKKDQSTKADWIWDVTVERDCNAWRFCKEKESL